jgi:phosphoribosylformylglycinamidine cyclo-ligase
MYGEALLAPTMLYSPVTEALAAAGIVPHYCANITGHGWRKLMRHPGEFTYRITVLPPVPAVLDFIRLQAAIDDREAYGNLNMGAGFALFVSAGEAARCVEIAMACGVPAWTAGTVDEGARQVVIEPLRLTYAGDELHVRA